MTSCTTTLLVSLEQVWQHLLYKTEHPEAFVPGVSHVQILEKKPDFVLRQMEIQLEGRASTVIEKITWSPYHMWFELVAHNIFEGYVDNDALALDDTNTELKFTVHWQHKQAGELYDDAALVKKAVLQSAAHILKNKDHT